jgi:hypothetical protein
MCNQGIGREGTNKQRRGRKKGEEIKENQRRRKPREERLSGPTK